MSSSRPDTEDWGDSFDELDSSYWEEYLGGPEDLALEPAPALEEMDYPDGHLEDQPTSHDEVQSKQSSVASELTNREERFPTFWAASLAANRLQVANPLVTRDGNQFLVRYSWPKDLPLPAYRAGQRYTPEEIGYLLTSYADWMPIWKVAENLHRQTNAIEVQLNKVGLRYVLPECEDHPGPDLKNATQLIHQLLRGHVWIADHELVEKLAQFGLRLELESGERWQLTDLSPEQMSTLLQGFLRSPIFPLSEQQQNCTLILDLASLALLSGSPGAAARLALHAGAPDLLLRALRRPNDLGKGWMRIRSRTLSFVRREILVSFPEEFERYKHRVARRRDDYSVTHGFALRFHLSDAVDAEIASLPPEAQAIIQAHDLGALTMLSEKGSRLAAWLGADLCRQRMWANSGFPLDADKPFLAVAGHYWPDTEALLRMLRELLPFKESIAKQIAENIGF
jgi:hypothetical protein